MNILTVTEQYWPEGGGGTLATHLIVDVLSRFSDMEIRVISGTREPIRVDGVRYICTLLLRTKNKVKLWSNLVFLSKQEWFVKLLRSTDVVYISRYCYPLIPVAKKLGKRVVVHLHDYQPISWSAVVFPRNRDHKEEVVKYELLEHSSIVKAFIGTMLTYPSTFLCRKWLSKADTIICVSKKQAEIISYSASELKDKLTVIYNPLPRIPELRDKFNEPTLIYSGGSSYVKGFYVFLRTLLKVSKQVSKVKFLLTGARNYNKRDLEFLKTLHISKGIKFLGRLPYAEVLKLYAKSYAVLVPSIWEEPLPYVVMESMASGTIPIASNVGGIPEIVEDTYAKKVLFNPGNVEELKGHIESVLSMNKSELIAIGYQLRKHVKKKFSSRTLRKRLLNVFLS